MTYSRDEILKAWDESISRIARDVDDPTHEETAAAVAQVCTNCPGLKPKEINAALKSSTEQIESETSRAVQMLKQLKSMREGLPQMSDTDDIARTIEGMFEAADSMGLEEPDLDAIADVFEEKFPDFTPEQANEVAKAFHERMQDRERRGGSLPGLPRGPAVKK